MAGAVVLPLAAMVVGLGWLVGPSGLGWVPLPSPIPHDGAGSAPAKGHHAPRVRGTPHDHPAALLDPTPHQARAGAGERARHTRPAEPHGTAANSARTSARSTTTVPLRSGHPRPVPASAPRTVAGGSPGAHPLPGADTKPHPTTANPGHEVFGGNA